MVTFGSHVSCTQGNVVGRTAASFQLDDPIEAISVGTVVVRYAEDSEEQYKDHNKRALGSYRAESDLSTTQRRLITEIFAMTYYSDHANDLFRFYQSADPELLHQRWSDLLPDQPGLACDIGAGSGRDAGWLAGKGWEVIAVEPADELRNLGEQHTSSQAFQQGSVTWLDDRLPELKRLRALYQRFQLILISAVWMHLKPNEHERAMRIISELLAPDGLLIISLRHGPDDAGRFHPFETNDVIDLALSCGLTLNRDNRGLPDASRSLVSWDYLVFNALTPQAKQKHQ